MSTLTRLKDLVDRIDMEFRGLLALLGIQTYQLRYLPKWTLLALIIGVITGICSVILYKSLEYLSGVFEQVVPGNPYLSRLIAPFIGGLLVGPLIFTLAPEVAGGGTEEVLEAYHNRWGNLRFRVAPLKVLTSSITIGSGGSGGAEGPMVQTGAGIASMLGQIFRYSVRDRKIMVTCGVAAGLGSIFKAPLGSALFAVEFLYKRDVEVSALVPSVIASIVGYAVSSSILGFESLFHLPASAVKSPLELVLYLVLGVLMGISAVLFIRIFSWVKSFFKRIGIPPHFKPALGGLMVGLLALLAPEVEGGGYHVIRMCLEGTAPPSPLILLGLALAKMFATSFTIGSGGSGGVLVPSLCVGALLGRAFSLALKPLPLPITSTGAYALVGMASFFSAVMKVPLASIIFVCEISKGYSLLVPAMLAAAVAYAVSGDNTICEGQPVERIPRRD